MQDEERVNAKREAEFYKQQLIRQADDHKEQLARQKEAAKFYNTDGFWLAFWILGPLILLALGFNVG